MKNIFLIKTGLYFAILIAALSISSCKKLVDVPPPTTSINGGNVYASDATAISAVTSIYTSLSQGDFITGNNGLSLYAGLSADELTLYSGIINTQYIAYYKNALSSDMAGFELWNRGYYYLFNCNSAIEGLSHSTTLSPAVQQQLLGEVKFLRAFFNFYLTNLYGDIPLQLTTDPAVNKLLSRNSQDQVYQQIISDLNDAKAALSSNFLSGTISTTTSERVRPTKWAASALLARVYLYQKKWTDAEREASSIISQNGVFDLSPLNNVFLKASLANKEAIWQLQPVNAGWNTEDARVFLINDALGDSKPVFLSKFLLNAFETGDTRRTNWIRDTTIAGVSYSFPYKYKSAQLGATVNEYLMLFRLGEQYLIRAEAEANGAGGGTTGAISDINKIRSRAGLAPYVGASDAASLTAAILHERQVELFTEAGQRWFDLKRSGKVDAVMSGITPQKGGIWKSTSQLYPIYYGDIQKDQNLKQNLGY